MSIELNPVVSVGITTYKRPEGLKQVLDGLVQQTYSNLEIIVSDNCSDMPEVEKILADFERSDPRFRIIRQPVNIGMEANHTFVARQATGDLYLWLHDDDYIPENYIERCVARFADGPDIELVGPRADAYMEGRFWYSYRNYSNLGVSVFDRLWGLMPIGYTWSSAFQQYFYGVFRRETLQEFLWQDGEYYHKQTFSLFFEISERGYIHFVDDVKLKKYNFNSDFKKWRDKNYVDKPKRWKFAGSKVEELIPMTLTIVKTVAKSQKLSLWEKTRLIAFCFYNFLGAVLNSRIPLWKRILRFPFRLVRKLLHVIDRVLERILRS